MRWELVLLVLALAACRDGNLPSPAASGALEDWVLPTGKPPSRAEFGAIVAACQDRGRVAATGGLQPCLADYGVRRAP